MVDPVPRLEHFALATRARILDALVALADGGTGGHSRGSAGAVMILVCGGLADGVTELVCSRLQDCGYPYRLLDLARFPDGLPRLLALDGQRARRDGSPAADWRLDLDEITRRLRPLPRAGGSPAAARSRPRRRGGAAGRGDLGLMALLEDLPCPVVNRIGGGLSNNSKPYQALSSAGTGLQRAADARHQRPGRGPRLPRRARRGDLQVGQRHPLDRPPPRPRPSCASRSALRRPGAVPGVRARPQRPRAHCRRPGLRHPDRVRGGGLPLRPCSTASPPSSRRSTLPQTVEAACLRLAHAFDLLFAGIDLKRDSRRRVLLLRGQSLPGLSLLRASHRAADQHGARRSAAPRRPVRAAPGP